MAIPTVPTLTYDSPLKPGDTITVTIPVGESSAYRYVGSATFVYFGDTVFGYPTRVASGTHTFNVWITPDHFPGASQVTGVFTLETYASASGALIGSESKTFVVDLTGDPPQVGSLGLTEGNPAVTSAAIGAYVQGNSKVKWNLTPAPGSTEIKTATVTIEGVTYSGLTGTSETLSGSGTITVSATVVGSRGETSTSSQNITVLPWTPPAITAYNVQRATSGGTVSPTGTYAKTTATATASSLVVGGSQKNAVTWKLEAKPHSGTSWTQKATGTGTIPTTTVNNLSGTYAGSHDFRLTVSDKLGSSAAITTIANTSTTLHLGDGVVGVGKIHADGALDVAGDVYATGFLGTGVALANGGLSVTSSITAGSSISAEGNITGTNITAVTQVSANRIRLSSTGDASLSSTNHAFQIGSSNSLNLIMDQNEIQARNDGSSATLSLNVDGGGVSIGNTGTTVSLPGRLNSTHLPWAMASGITTTPSSGYQTVTFPSGRFSQPPVVTATNGAPSTVTISRVVNVTTTSFQVGTWTVAGTQTNGSNVMWTAVQMSSGSASG